MLAVYDVMMTSYPHAISTTEPLGSLPRFGALHDSEFKFGAKLREGHPNFSCYFLQESILRPKWAYVWFNRKDRIRKKTKLGWSPFSRAVHWFLLYIMSSFLHYVTDYFLLFCFLTVVTVSCMMWLLSFCGFHPGHPTGELWCIWTLIYVYWAGSSICVPFNCSDNDIKTCACAKKDNFSHFIIPSHLLII
jgi:hypothetical protein